MDTEQVIYIVGTRCHPNKENEFNRWYDEVHIPLLLRFRGLKEVTRYKLIKNENEKEDYPEYLTLYKFDNLDGLESYLISSERANALAEMKETWKDGELEVKWQIFYKAIKKFQR